MTVSAGLVDFASGRSSIVTAAGPGGSGNRKVFITSLMTPVKAQDQESGPPQPATTASFAPFGEGYRGGVSLATGWLAGSLGGAERIVVGQLGDGGKVKVFSSGSRLDGGPPMYLHSAMAHQHIEFAEIARASTPSMAMAVSASQRRAPPPGRICWWVACPRRTRRRGSSNISLCDRMTARRCSMPGN